MVLSFFSIYTPEQRRDIAIYVTGIIAYKLALEYFNGAFITMANERFGDERYQKIGLLTGLNSAAQCVGSIVVAPLIKRVPTRTVLSCAVLAFGVVSAILLVVDAATGGKLKYKTPDNNSHYGNWNPNFLFPVYIVSGFAYGQVELIRRVIPRDIVGGDVSKLRRMDAIVHILYEVAGTIGAVTSKNLIDIFGYNNSYLLSPPFFAIAALVWASIGTLGHPRGRSQTPHLTEVDYPTGGYFRHAGRALRAFAKAFYLGAVLVFTHRRFVWLVPGYSFALYGHRYLENQLAPIFAKQVLGTSSYAQIMVGASNFGELLGALSVALAKNRVPTPLPWLRLDAFLLQIIWVLPFLHVKQHDVRSAWRVALCFLPISYGWAAGDVSLAAYIQGTLARMESTDKDVSALGAVMAFLYVTYIVIYAMLSSVLGNWVDSFIESGHSGSDVLKYVGGVQFTVLSAIVLISTFTPRNAFAFNPEYIDNALTSPSTDSMVSDDGASTLSRLHPTVRSSGTRPSIDAASYMQQDPRWPEMAKVRESRDGEEQEPYQLTRYKIAS